MNRTKIPWCDWTWNPIVGCSPYSDGCDNCYAAAISKRFHLPWGSAVLMEDRLDEPERVKKPGRIFVCSMGDLGHPTVREEWRQLVLNAMRRAPWHTYIILTKRPGAWIEPFADDGAWIGVTCEREARVYERWSVLSQVRAAVRFVSVEPMLEPISFEGWKVRPDWGIAGPETGPKARRCDDAWIDALADQSPCFFDKRKDGKRREFPMPNAGAVSRRGSDVGTSPLLGIPTGGGK